MKNVWEPTHINALPGFIQSLLIVNHAVLLILVPFLLVFQSESKKNLVILHMAQERSSTSCAYSMGKFSRITITSHILCRKLMHNDG